MIWAAMLLCFYGFLRTGEVVVPSNTEFDPSQHLTHDDIAVDKIRDPSFVTVRIKQSKTDPFRKGVTVVIGRAAGPLCPLAAILSYMARRKPGKGSLFWFEDGRPLTRDHFVMKVREALQQIQKLCRTQLQNWSCNYCGEERDTGLTNKNIRSMGECGIPTICQNTMRAANYCGSHTNWLKRIQKIDAYRTKGNIRNDTN